MEDEEYYYNEKRPDGGSWIFGGSSGGGGGGWGGGGGGGGGGGWGGRDPFAPVIAPPRVNRTLTGYMFLDKDGLLLSCRQDCAVVPALVAYINGEAAGGHGRCVLCKTTSEKRPAKMVIWAPFDGTANKPAAIGYWPIGAPGTYRVRVKWQAGHYDYSKIKRAKFYIYGVSTGWLTMALKSWTTVATVTVAEDYRLTVNGTPGHRAGNLQFLES